MVKQITSVENTIIKDIAKLKDSSYRKKTDLCVVEGTRAIETFISSEHELQQIYATEPNIEFAQKIADEKKITLVNYNVATKISSATTPSGIAAVFKIKKPTAKLGQGLILFQISDPGNMGTLIRTAAALNVKTVVVIEGVDVWTNKVIQASAGTISKVDIFQMSFKELVEKKENLKLISLVVTGGKSPQEIDTKNSLLIVGSEAHGLPLQVLNESDELMTLPMPGNIESLNVAVAGSIALYQTYLNPSIQNC
ncbi:RNA methyltransferase [Candidatus Dependentiae bacterium]|nr:RNA methyltransferase [Candidatus Dependentiae bacterium]